MAQPFERRLNGAAPGVASPYLSPQAAKLPKPATAPTIGESVAGAKRVGQPNYGAMPGAPAAAGAKVAAAGLTPGAGQAMPYTKPPIAPKLPGAIVPPYTKPPVAPFGGINGITTKGAGGVDMPAAGSPYTKPPAGGIFGPQGSSVSPGTKPPAAGTAEQTPGGANMGLWGGGAGAAGGTKPPVAPGGVAPPPQIGPQGQTYTKPPVNSGGLPGQHQNQQFTPGGSMGGTVRSGNGALTQITDAMGNTGNMRTGGIANPGGGFRQGGAAQGGGSPFYGGGNAASGQYRDQLMGKIQPQLQGIQKLQQMANQATGGQLPIFPGGAGQPGGGYWGTGTQLGNKMQADPGSGSDRSGTTPKKPSSGFIVDGGLNRNLASATAEGDIPLVDDNGTAVTNSFSGSGQYPPWGEAPIGNKTGRPSGTGGGMDSTRTASAPTPMAAGPSSTGLADEEGAMQDWEADDEQAWQDAQDEADAAAGRTGGTTGGTGGSSSGSTGTPYYPGSGGSGAGGQPAGGGVQPPGMGGGPIAAGGGGGASGGGGTPAAGQPGGKPFYDGSQSGGGGQTPVNPATPPPGGTLPPTRPPGPAQTPNPTLPANVPLGGQGGASGGGGSVYGQADSLGQEGWGEGWGNASSQGTQESHSGSVGEKGSTSTERGQGTSTSTGRSKSNTDVLWTDDPLNAGKYVGSVGREAAVNNPWSAQLEAEAKNRARDSINAGTNANLERLRARAAAGGMGLSSDGLAGLESDLWADQSGKGLASDSQIGNQYATQRGEFDLGQRGQDITQRGQDVGLEGMKADIAKSIFGQTKSASESSQDAASQNTSAGDASSWGMDQSWADMFGQNTSQSQDYHYNKNLPVIRF